MRRFVSSAAMGAALLVSAPAVADTLVEVESEHLNEDVPMPTFAVDASWPRLPDNITLGQTPGLSVDRDDNIWILNRPNSLDFTDTGADSGMSVACCNAPPHVIQFDQDGNVLRSWGGTDLAPGESTYEGEGQDRREIGDEQWPANVHGLYVDDDLNVWLGGNGGGDHVVLNFTADGEFIRQIGTRQQTDGNMSRQYLGNPADIHFDGESVLVADGYINKRVIEFGADDLAFEHLWGAYGTDPDGGTREGEFDQSQASSTGDGGANPESESFGDIVHCVTRGPDDTIYVCDRRNNRLQIFRETADGVEFVQDVVIAEETGGTRTASDIAFSPRGKCVCVTGMAWALIR